MPNGSHNWMSKKEYRLETVLDVRRKEKEGASKAVFEARQFLELAVRELERRQEVLQNHRSDMSEAETRLQSELMDGSAATRIVSHKVFIEGLRDRETALIDEVASQASIVRQAEAALEETIKRLTEAARELSVIEKHKRKWQSREQKRVTKEDQKLLDEISSILHERSEKL